MPDHFNCCGCSLDTTLPFIGFDPIGMVIVTLRHLIPEAVEFHHGYFHGPYNFSPESSVLELQNQHHCLIIKQSADGFDEAVNHARTGFFNPYITLIVDI